MLKRVAAQLPLWARPDHPLVRHELARQTRLTWRAHLLRGLWIGLLLAALLAGGYLIATGALRQPAGLNLTDSAAAVIYWPLLAGQVTLGIAASAITGRVIADARRRQTWDKLRATAGGTELALRAQWALTFYRLRGPLGIVLLLRAALIIGILYDMTAFQGRYLDLLISGIVPVVPLALAAVLLACAMTAGLLLPLTGIGFDAALGLWVGAAFQMRTYATLAQVVLAIARGTLLGGLALAAHAFLSGALALPDGGGWALLAAYGALGDWGLAGLNLAFTGEVWAIIPYGIVIGPALLLFALAQAAASDWVLARAIRRAEQAG